jgi:hypothetical protein
MTCGCYNVLPAVVEVTQQFRHELPRPDPWAAGFASIDS